MKRDKVTLSDAICIRVRARRGEVQADLAREYGLTPGAITAIVQSRTHNNSAIVDQVRRKFQHRRNGPGIGES